MICSFKYVGRPPPPTNSGTPLGLMVFGDGNAPVARNALAAGLISEAGIVLFGNGWPGVNPRAVKRLSSAGLSSLAVGTLITPIDIGITPLAMEEFGTCWLNAPP